jgi:hypothetical protein
MGLDTSGGSQCPASVTRTDARIDNRVASEQCHSLATVAPFNQEDVSRMSERTHCVLFDTERRKTRSSRILLIAAVNTLAASLQ